MLQAKTCDYRLVMYVVRANLSYSAYDTKEKKWHGMARHSIAWLVEFPYSDILWSNLEKVLVLYIAVVDEQI